MVRLPIWYNRHIVRPSAGRYSLGDVLRDNMSAKAAGRILLITITLVLLILALPEVPAMSGGVHFPRLSIGDPPAAPSDISHSQQQRDLGRPAVAAPPVPKDVQAYLPLLTRPPLCDLNPEEETIAALATGHPEQERETMSCHPILAQVAREHAVDMATRDYFDHCNPEDFGPNYRVEQAGYDLPLWYNHELCDDENDNNNIESIAASLETAEAAWNWWLTTDSRDHVLGRGKTDFFADQTNYGVGYAFSADSTYKHYWVFISAPPLEE